MKIECINVEYGECTVFVGDKKQIFMTDCGSSNNKLRKPNMDITEVYAFIMDRYASSPRKTFLLSHYHRDHYSGFKWIYRQEKDYFTKILLPYIPRASDGTSPILEYAILSAIANSHQNAIGREKFSLLTIFDVLSADLNRIQVVAAGDSFVFDTEVFKLISPVKDNFPYGENFLSLVRELKTSLDEEMITGMNNFILQYYNVMDMFTVGGRLQEKESAVKRLRNFYELLFGLHKIIDSELINSRSSKEIFSKELNNTSVIYHSANILMTGDAGEDVVNIICDKLYRRYQIVKAPHHGRDSGYWNIFPRLEPSNYLISCGDYGEDNKISGFYLASEAFLHCTNNSACPYYKEYKSCCNRLKFCGDIGTLSLKCRASREKSPKGACGIYVVAPNRGRGCFCD